MTLFLAAGCALLFAAGTMEAQERDATARETRELPAPPKVKSKRSTSEAAPAPAVQKDSAPKPVVPHKDKSTAVAVPREEKKLPKVEKPAKPSA